MSKSPEVLLEHIIQSAELVQKYIKGKTRLQFFEDIGLQDKVIRRLAVIGEAVKGLPKSFLDGHPDIAWKDIAGMRDVLVHEYYDVDTSLVWKVARIRVPQLARYLSYVLQDTLKE